MWKLLLSCILLSASSLLLGQEKNFRDTLVSDFKTFVKYLETTHPDPYSGFGGKVFFSQKAAEVEQQLRRQDYTKNDFVSLLGAFIAPMEDGHTGVWAEQGKTGKALRLLPVTLKVIPDQIIIGGICDSLKQFLGSRVKTVNGVPLEQLLEKISTQIACENRYGQYMTLANDFPAHSFLKRRFFPNLGETVTIGVELPDGSADEIVLSFLDQQTWNKLKQTVPPSYNEVAGMDYLSYKFLDKQQQTMYFRFQSVMAREAYLFMHNNGWGQIDEQVKNFYQWTLHKEMPANIDSAIAGIPVMAEEFGKMLQQMKKNHSKYLIIDLRNNGGGFTPITLPTLYQLYGDDYLTTNMGVDFYRLISPLYMQKINSTLEDYNKQNHTEFAFGDYQFERELSQNKPTEQLRKEFVEQSMGNAGEFISGLNGKPLYTPQKVFVITNSRTFSAAFHYAFYLWKMGAVVVGVPSSQAPNTFMEQTPFVLPLTGINGSISNSAQYFLPPTDKRAKTFYPDFIPTYSDYKKYNFDQQTELLYLLEMMGK